ncbi:MAG: hypothetical protein J6R91_05470 [Bacteroidaceae bacterium]|nr:hypothetical protein [Bacteroidaceae bacterium]
MSARRPIDAAIAYAIELRGGAIPVSVLSPINAPISFAIGCQSISMFSTPFIAKVPANTQLSIPKRVPQQ